MSEVEDLDGEGGRTHSKFAPSALKRILSCPRSVALSEALGGTGKSSIYAAQGSVAHTVAEGYLRNDRVFPAVGTFVEHEGHKVEVDDDMHRYGSDYAVYVTGLMVPGDFLFVESTVNLNAIVGEAANMYGHADAVIWSPSRGLLIVVDYKYGRGIKVVALDNPQMKAYGLGAMTSLPAIDPDEVKTIQTHIFQPRTPGVNIPDTIPAVDLLRWGHEDVEPVVASILKDGAIGEPYVTGDHCRFCPAIAQCPAMRDRAVRAAQKAFGASPLPATALSDDELGIVLDEVDVVEPWFDAARAEALSRAERGSRIKGRKLVASRGRRVWTQAEPLVRAALSSMGLTRAEILEPETLRSPAQIEKKVSKDNKDEFKKLWTLKSSGHSLARADDPRPGVSVATAAEVFSNASSAT